MDQVDCFYIVQKEISRIKVELLSSVRNLISFYSNELCEKGQSFSFTNYSEIFLPFTSILIILIQFPFKNCHHYT